MPKRVSVQTSGPGLYEITGRVADMLQGAPENGLVHLFIQHTSASLLIQENADPEVQTDLLAFFQRLVPPSDDPSMSYLTHTYEGPDDLPGHIKSALLPVSLTIPLANGRMQLGTWQGIYLVEHRARAHRRTVLMSVVEAASW